MPATRRPPLAAIIIGLTVIMAAMLLAFITPAIHSGAKNLPLAVNAPPPALAQLSGMLDTVNPGAFDLIEVESAEAVTDKVSNREAIGGLVMGPDGVSIITASGAGGPYTVALNGLGAGMAAQGQEVTYTDVAPLPAKDPMGVGLTALMLPLIFGGMASGVLLARFVTSRGVRIAGVLATAVVAGYTAAAIVQLWFGATETNFWLLGAVIALGIAAISATVLGMEAVMGLAGVGLAAVVMLFISNPLSGMAAGPEFLPAPWGAIGQYLPMGAAASSLRSTAYFDGRGMVMPIIVLTVWTVAGLALAAMFGKKGAAAGLSLPGMTNGDGPNIEAEAIEPA